MDIIILFGLAIMGWLAGALINYLSDVLPVTRRFSAAECPECCAPRSVVDYLLVRGCQKCGKRRSARAWVVQIAAVGAAVGFWLRPSTRLDYWSGMLVLVYFGLVTVIDMEHRLILHPTSLVGAVIGAALGLARHGWLATLLGGAAGFGIMYGLVLFGAGFAWVLGKMRGQPIEEDAMGFGDAMLGGVLGLLMGWPGIGGGLFLAILLGGVGSIVILVRQFFTKQYEAFQAIPYGPFMVAAAVIMLFLM